MEHYKVVESDNITALVEEVEQLIGHGWMPAGGISILRYTYEDRKGYTESTWWYAQAMMCLPEYH